ncbi:hypothetical protein AAU57_08835 [Nonlabens sp. YIK11]|uniref:hypothetical protein n=1 Tax=Nonlabens sp. YIK11 TaxID=1453349 RepID=UPI0006DC3F4C|nr:hypothetical protein [Nonlabens sp. YIK11]KQC33408.1 hypothetical protein AAU57_08835 [Nonlabens sp. YIK11]
MNCNNKITADILQDCADLPKKGLAGSKAVIVNYYDIDQTATTVSGSTVTNLELVSGASGLQLEWFKDLASTNSTFAANTEDIDGFTHSFLSRISNTSAESAERANELKNSRVVMVVETKYKGADNADAYKIYGFENGLVLSEMTTNSNENSSSILFTLASGEGEVEQYPYLVLNEGDYATNKASYDSLFAAV